MTETTTLRGALIMPYPSALGPADEPLTIEWPGGHSYAVVATAFHGGAELGTTAIEDEAWEIYDQWPKTDCRCGCRGIVTRDGLRLRRGGSPQKRTRRLTEESMIGKIIAILGVRVVLAGASLGISFGKLPCK